MGRSNRYLESSQTRKEPIARKIAEKEGIEEGLICVLRAVEPCMSYDIYRNRQVSRRLNPAHGRIFRGLPIEYYWTVYQDEWATDLMFRSTGELAALYPARMRGAMACFTSPGVMRFLEKKPHGSFAGEVVSEVCRRPEGIRVKHRVKANSVKMYDKGGGRVLRIETTMNDPGGFKVFRPLEGNPAGEKAWRPLARGIANLGRLAEIGQSSNDRCLDALAALDTDVPISTLVDRVCRAVDWEGCRVRALRPWEENDRLLLKVISRGEFAVGDLR